MIRHAILAMCLATAVDAVGIAHACTRARVDLAKLDFAPTARVRKLDLGAGQQNLFNGEVSAAFVPARPFAFQPAD